MAEALTSDNVVLVFSKRRHGSLKLSANFTVAEFACKDNSDTILIDLRLVDALQAIRDHYQKPLRILSAYRTSPYNAKVGGEDYSKHLLGIAADIDPSTLGVTPKELAAFVESHAAQLGVGGIGIYPTFVHIDTRADKARWSK